VAASGLGADGEEQGKGFGDRFNVFFLCLKRFQIQEPATIMVSLATVEGGDEVRYGSRLD
jgi:hypothetical protein